MRPRRTARFIHEDMGHSSGRIGLCGGSRPRGARGSIVLRRVQRQGAAYSNAVHRARRAGLNA
ncbi:hypothetical protein GCM10009782_05460 [Glycomyces algeriensis]